jgi:biotin carboxyl carrier protein
MTDDADGRATIARLTHEVLPALIERLSRSDLGELEVRESGWRIRLRRPLDGAAGPARPVSQHGAQSGNNPPRDTSPGLVTSPGVGYFAPRVGVQTGTTLRSGDVLGHVDVLGVRHEVVTSVAGSLRAFEVESGQAVEFGQPIARLEPEG